MSKCSSWGMNHPHPNHFFHHVTFQSHQDSIAFPSSIQKLAKYKLNMALSLQAAPTLIQPAKVGSMPGRTGSPHLKPSKLSKAFGFEQAGSTKRPGGFALFLAGSILCRRTTDSVQDEDRFSRRDVLKCFSTIIGMEMIASSGSFTEKSYAADLIQRRQRSEFLSNIKGTFYTAIKDNAELIPSILMLALNDAMTYDKATKSGGPNGSIRFSSEISRPENRGLSAALRLLEEAKKEIDSYSKGGPLTYADLIQFAAQSAVKYTFLASAIRKCGGNEEKGNLLYTAYGSNGQWGLFDRQFGRSDAEDPDPDGRILQWERASVQEMKDKFSAIGFGPRQLAVMSAFLGPDQLATESSLASDPEVLPWVQKYQRSRETVSQTDYEGPLLGAMVKTWVVQCENVDSSMESSHFVQKAEDITSIPPSTL